MNKKILRLAIPNILSNLTVPLLSSVDTAIMGHLPDPAYLGAIAIGSMIFNFLYWGFGFLRMGTTGMTAQSFGKKDNKEIIQTLTRAVLVAVSFAILFILLKNIIGNISFSLVNASSDVETFGRQYFDIRIYAAPATLSLYAFNGWFLGMQNSRFPLFLSVFINLVNIGLNFLFVYQYNMDVEGIAWATVIAQYSGIILAIVLFNFSYKDYLNYIDLKKIFELEKIKKFFSINFDIFIRTLCLIFVFSYFTAESAAYGDTILAANSILLQLWMILSYGIDGFAFAAESLVGKYIGAKKRPELLKVIRLTFYWSIGLGILFSFLFLLDIKGFIQLYTNQQLIIDTALTFAIWTIIAPLINSFSFVWDGVYIGATATKTMRNSMLFSTIVIFLPVYFLTKGFYGSHSLWLAMILFMLARGVTLSALAKNSIFGMITKSKIKY